MWASKSVIWRFQDDFNLSLIIDVGKSFVYILICVYIFV